MKRIAVIFDRAIDFLAYMSGVLVFLLMAIISAEIFTRKVLGLSIYWAVESSEHITYFITFLCAAWILKYKQHIRVDVVLERIGCRWHLLLETITFIIGAALCLFIAYRAGLTSIDLWQRHINTVTELELPMAPLVAVMCIGLLFLSIQFIREAHSTVKKWNTGSDKSMTEITKNVQSSMRK